MIILTNTNRSKFKLGKESDIDNAIDIDGGVVTPSMGLPKKYWYEDCIILILKTL